MVPFSLSPNLPLCQQAQIYPYPIVWPFRDHGLRPRSLSPSERCKPYAQWVFCLWCALFWIWSCRPRAQGVGVDPCLAQHETAVGTKLNNRERFVDFFTGCIA